MNTPSEDAPGTELAGGTSDKCSEVLIREAGTILQVPGTGSNHEAQGGERDWEKAVSKIHKIKHKDGALKSLEDFSEVLNCGELKWLLITSRSYFSSYLARDLHFLWVPGMVSIPFLTRLSRGLARVCSQVWSPSTAGSNLRGLLPF